MKDLHKYLLFLFGCFVLFAGIAVYSYMQIIKCENKGGLLMRPILSFSYKCFDVKGEIK